MIYYNDNMITIRSMNHNNAHIIFHEFVEEGWHPFALNNTISLAVGLRLGYGDAQRIYVKRGYIPDGSGVWYQDRQLE